jgi:putative ABC transport system permease protein
MIEGRLEDIRLPHTVIVDDLALTRLSPVRGQKLKMGDVLEINDQEARVVGICEAATSFTGGPYVWTTYDRALQYAPGQRKMLSAVIAAPREGVSAEQAAADIAEQTGLKAFVNSGFTFKEGASATEFNTATVFWYMKNTGIPISFGITVIVGFVVGLAISCQTFYSFVLEHMKHLGALKAMGASTLQLCLMLVTQALTAGLVGFGLGMLFTALFAKGALAREQPPFFMPEIVPFLVLGVIVMICLFSALLGIIRVSRLEAAMVFRG